MRLGRHQFQEFECNAGARRTEVFLAFVSTAQPVRISGYLTVTMGPIDASVSRHLRQAHQKSGNRSRVQVHNFGWASHLLA
jgi:hypothetical protein